MVVGWSMTACGRVLGSCSVSALFSCSVVAWPLYANLLRCNQHDACGDVVLAYQELSGYEVSGQRCLHNHVIDLQGLKIKACKWLRKKAVSSHPGHTSFSVVKGYSDVLVEALHKIWHTCSLRYTTTFAWLAEKKPIGLLCIRWGKWSGGERWCQRRTKPWP